MLAPWMILGYSIVCNVTSYSLLGVYVYYSPKGIFNVPIPGDTTAMVLKDVLVAAGSLLKTRREVNLQYEGRLGKYVLIVERIGNETKEFPVPLGALIQGFVSYEALESICSGKIALSTECEDRGPYLYIELLYPSINLVDSCSKIPALVYVTAKVNKAYMITENINILYVPLNDFRKIEEAINGKMVHADSAVLIEYSCGVEGVNK
ncbi:hypothetical protein IPA_07910 [Ignicoccus pacificus DSM 13166]|uniref:Uncharacterized protein n=1 Tax=Ignicoccus pacificus DSM 13166 TaxID=940294 RepID=A0A977KBQ5_9CREN|nr:hypothetical protein IPA_07910 [Ignicoccus pacificus DSM 13166]